MVWGSVMISPYLTTPPQLGKFIVYWHWVYRVSVICYPVVRRGLRSSGYSYFLVDGELNDLNEFLNCMIVWCNLNLRKYGVDVMILYIVIIYIIIYIYHIIINIHNHAIKWNITIIYDIITKKNTVAKIPSPYILNSPRKPLLSREFTDIWHHKKWES